MNTMDVLHIQRSIFIERCICEKSFIYVCFVVFNRATLCIAQSLLSCGVCPSVTVTRIVSKRLNLSQNFLDQLVAPSFRFFLTPAPIADT